MRPPAVIWSALLATCALLLSVTACSSRPDFMPGDDCELNTDCEAPLVCRLGRCRVECRAQRDCAAGLECVRDALGLGACQIESETDCTLASDCPDFLVCRFGRCTNACEIDRDCPPGARCEEEEGGGRGCRDQAETLCERHSDCAFPLICATDERCRPECQEDKDCRSGRICAVWQTDPTCVPPEDRPDGGAMDGGAMDGGVVGDDGGTATIPVPDPPRMAAGLGHTCAATAAGELYCWGWNFEGQVGDGTFTDVSTPRRVALDGVTLVGAGAVHSCAVAADGLHCWGSNALGQLGVGTTVTQHNTPQAVGGVSGVTDLALGNSHTCVLATGEVYCWGENNVGQLGDGSTTNTDSPGAPVALGGTPLAISTFGFHTCALLSGGTVECWGDDGDGRLGHSMSGVTPRPVPGISDAVQVTTGTTHTCVLRATGQVLCFGSNSHGQAGLAPSATPRTTPGPVDGLTEPALELALGSTHSCARTAVDIFCWGQNQQLQLGQMSAVASSGSALAVGVGVVDEIDAGSNHTCFRAPTGSLWCFGSNIDGQLGSGSAMTRSDVPMMVSGL